MVTLVKTEANIENVDQFTDQHQRKKDKENSESDKEDQKTVRL